MQRVLERQVRKYLGNTPLPAEFSAFLKVVSKTYEDFDEDRKLAERSLEISSKELIEVNRNLAKDIEQARQRTEDLELLNKAMVGREMRMIELKREIEALKEALSKAKDGKQAGRADTNRFASIGKA